MASDHTGMWCEDRGDREQPIILNRPVNGFVYENSEKGQKQPTPLSRNEGDICNFFSFCPLIVTERIDLIKRQMLQLRNQ